MAETNGTGWPDPQIHAVQAAAEGVKLTGYVTFRGRQFRLGTHANTPAMLDFSAGARDGLATGDQAGMAAMRDMIKGCFVLTPSCGQCEICDNAQTEQDFEQCPQFDPGDWPKFWRLARAVMVDGEELFEVIGQAMEQIMARPTPAPSGSSSPPPAESPNLRAPSSVGKVPQDFLNLPPGDLIDVSSALRSPR